MNAFYRPEKSTHALQHLGDLPPTAQKSKKQGYFYNIMRTSREGISFDGNSSKWRTPNTSFHLSGITTETENPVKKIKTELPAGNEHILLVDDEEVITTLGTLILEKLGYHVTVENSSIDALSLVESDPDIFDLVITDQIMPEMTGNILADKITKLKPDMPIVMCSGYTNTVNTNSFKSFGIRAFVPKPFSINSLAAVIRHVLDNQ